MSESQVLPQLRYDHPGLQKSYEQLISFTSENSLSIARVLLGIIQSYKARSPPGFKPSDALIRYIL